MMLTDLIKLTETRLEPLFANYLQNKLCPAPKLQEAMAYSVFNGGKRLRPLIVYATGYALNAAWENCDAPACAIELIHAYSLIHDDLPAMDNSDFRRGKASCHKAYNEALAILAGDALQPLAFQILAAHPAKLDSQHRLTMITILSHAAGMYGMVAGQTLDIEGTHDLPGMYCLKTGALLIASVKLGAIAAGIQNPDILSALEKYAQNIGLAFQIQDDLLDFESSEITGKPQGLDDKNTKQTYPVLHGIEKTYLKIKELFTDATEAIQNIGCKTETLHELANLIMQRKM